MVALDQHARGGREMPPWHLDKTVGIQHFINDASLTDQQIDTIVRWVDAGAPRGNPADLPPPVEWPNEDQFRLERVLGPPDLVDQVEAVDDAGAGAGHALPSAG